jgi:LmbE family N-acetylglucosaminyl deacetylase
MKPSAPLALALCLSLPLSAPAQQTNAPTRPFTDPANLRGERVAPTDGHELPIDQGSLGLAQLLRKLNTRASILNIVAHPDDEDGGMLTLYARGFGARVTDLALTRGEGGQNFMTGDFEDALGLIRTQELLANDRYTGVHQLFGTEVDFGFSKTKEEAFAKWTHDRVLYDAVRAIRLVRPLVITATFIGNVTDGHGQHQVSGEIAQEAFKAAADPNVFPDQIAEGLLPWQALRVYARVPFADINAKGVYDYATNQLVPARFTNYVTGAVTTTKPNADVEVPEGTNDPLLTTCSANPHDLAALSSVRNAGGSAAPASSDCTPFSYVQFARIGLGLQRSQISRGMRLPTPGSYDSGYTLYGSVLCNAPASARPSSLTPKTCQPEQAQRAEGPPTQTAATALLASFHPDSVILPTSLGYPEASASGLMGSGRKGVSTPGHALPNIPDNTIPADLTTHPNFFTGIDTSVEGIATLVTNPPTELRKQLHFLSAKIEEAQKLFDPAHPERSASALTDALNAIVPLRFNLPSGIPEDQKLNVIHELRVKQAQLSQALALSLGLSLRVSDATSADLLAHEPATVQATISTRSEQAAMVEADLGEFAGAEISGRHSITTDHPFSFRCVKSADVADVTRPYFFRKDIEQPVYELRTAEFRNAPSTPPAFTCWARVIVKSREGYAATVELGTVVRHNTQPISIIPPVSLASAPTATVLPTNQLTAQLTATLTTEAHTNANINVQSPHNWSIEAKAASPNSVNFILHPTAPVTEPAIFHLTATTPDHHAYTEGFRSVGYPGLILTNYYTPATTRVVPVALKLPQHVRIAYLPGTGDAVPESLASIGLTPTLLTVADLTPGKLSSFETVILGVRTYSAHPDLHGAPTQALLDFARNGGNVLVQYQASDFTSADAPYPLSLGPAEKVVVESDPVQLLAPTNPLLTTPNGITSADFNNWIEERGHGFLESWDSHYTPLTETHDPGGPVTPAQLPQRGGLITATVGKGRWTYCAFAIYRQLPEAVPGAFRLFVNLLTPAR